MSFFSQFSTAIVKYSQGFPYLFKKGYKRYLALPIIINLTCLILVIWASFKYSDDLIDSIFGLFGYSLYEMSKAWSSVLVISMQIIQFLLFLSFYKYLVLIVLAPFLAFLSEKIEKEKMGEDFPFSIHQLFKDIIRALIINVWNFLREIGFTVALSLFGFIPVLTVFTPIFILLVQAYFYGYGLMDYNAERWRFGFKETEKWMWQNKGAVLAIGLVFHFLFLIPFVGWIFAPIWGVIAGSLKALEIKEDFHPQS